MIYNEKIGFQLLGDDNWLGGIYYITNIISAIISLPVEKRPEICLIVSPWVNKKHFDVLANQVEILVYPPIKSIESNHKLLHKVARKLRILFGNGYDYKYAKYLMEHGVGLLYPTLSSMSKNFPIKWIAWIPDLQHKEIPEYFSKKQINDRDFTYSKISKEAQKIVFSSIDSQKTFQRYFHCDSLKCEVLNFKSIINNKWLAADGKEVLSKYNLKENNYFIISNQWWTHKNHITAFKAALELKNRGKEITLVCTGSTKDYRNKNHFNNLVDFINRSSLTNNIRILGSITRYDQIQLII